MSKLRWLTYSLFLHVMAVGPLFFVITDAKNEVSSQMVQIDFVAAKTLDSASIGNQNAQPKKTKASALARQLFAQNYTREIAEKVRDQGQADSVQNFSDSSTYAFDSSNYLGSNDKWEFFRQVFERIDSRLLFDSILAQYNHFGSVFVEFTVDSKGRFVEKRMKVTAADAILKVHALRALKLSLQSEFRQEKWNPTGHTETMKAKFEFVLADSSLNFEKQKDFGKPVFIFRRATAEKPIASNLKDHLLSGGVGADPFAVYERWEKYNKKNAAREHEFDPFGAYRTDPLYNL